jgi:hypothetical protein
MVGYNVQSAVDTKHHLIVAHEVTNAGSDRGQLSDMTEQARAAIGSEAIEAVADRGYYSGEEIVACEQAGITVYLPKPMTSGLLAKGRFGKQDFVYVAADDVYLCPSGEQLTYHYTNDEDGKTLRRYWTNACKRTKSESDLRLEFLQKTRILSSAVLTLCWPSTLWVRSFYAPRCGTCASHPGPAASTSRARCSGELSWGLKGENKMTVPRSSTLIEFRRCPNCRRAEVVETGEVTRGSRNHDRCGVEAEKWVRFKAPSDWRPPE